MSYVHDPLCQNNISFFMFGNEVQMRMFLPLKKLSQNFIIVFCYYSLVVNCVVIEQMALRFGLSHIITYSIVFCYVRRCHSFPHSSSDRPTLSWVVNATVKSQIGLQIIFRKLIWDSIFDVFDKRVEQAFCWLFSCSSHLWYVDNSSRKKISIFYWYLHLEFFYWDCIFQLAYKT